MQIVAWKCPMLLALAYMQCSDFNISKLAILNFVTKKNDSLWAGTEIEIFFEHLQCSCELPRNPRAVLSQI